MNKDLVINNELHFMNFKRLNDNNIINLFTFKPYNFRKNLVSNEEINNNFNRLQSDLNYKFDKIIKPIQTHTNNVLIVVRIFVY